jgi:glutamate-ammonia-ligase adenylyltransferase
VSPLNFAVLAFGKLGGMELNYSSDIDLLAVYDNSEKGPDAAAETYYSAVFRRLVQDLTEFTDEGQAYRVDLRLRPHGNAGPPVVSCASAARYYESDAELWELQAMIKCRPVAGAMKLGGALVSAVHEAAARRSTAAEVVDSVTRMRETAQQVHVRDGQTDVKNGAGGIRDVEFLAQALQLVHAKEHPGMLVPDTLSALARLTDTGILDRNESRVLSDDYQLLRQAEHFLQLAEDRQLHNLPDDDSGLARLAFTLRFPGGGASVADHIRERMAAVHKSFRDHLHELK